jgi:hypothetical protein
MARIPVQAYLVAAFAATAACSSAPEQKTERPSSSVDVALTPLASCGDVEAAIREAALREMNRKIDANLRQFLAQSNDCYGGYEDSAGAPTASGAGGGSSSGDGAKQVSGTNNQVAGVDEADFVKNDDEYIYVVSGGALRIIDAWPAAETHEIARVTLPGTPKKLFVSGNRALVYASIGAQQDPYGYGYGGSECTYGYDCDFSGDGTRTKILIYDLTDRSQPALLREIDVSGSYISARRVGDAVHTVLHDQRTSFDGVQYWPQSLSWCDQGVSPLETWITFESLRQKNAEIIRSAPLSDYLPSVVDVKHGAAGIETSSNLLAACEGFYRSPLGDGSGYITLLSLGLDASAPPTTSTIVSRPGAVYASADALYVAVRQSSDYGYGWYPSMEGVEQASTIHKFALSSVPAKSSYAASGIVKGNVLNQFAMDEHAGHLRVATTTGHLPDPNVHSTLSVLAHQGAELVTVGVVDRLAPGEDIRSARMSGDKAFIVTFKKTDPLFVIELSNPRAPKVLAELKIPGFSTYMHMLDDTHLLTIGYDAAEQGDFAWFTGVMLQIFDVTIPTAPKQLYKEIIGTRGSSSEALTNHLAFNYFAPKNLLSFPITVCEGGDSDGGYGTTMTFSGLMVYDVTLDSGFSLRGKVAHPSNVSSGYYENAACSNWWTQASSEVKRSIIMDDFVFSISDSLLKVNHLDALGNDLKALSLAD